MTKKTKDTIELIGCLAVIGLIILAGEYLIMATFAVNGGQL